MPSKKAAGCGGAGQVPDKASEAACADAPPATLLVHLLLLRPYNNSILPARDTEK